jgi:hypothetical protein
MYDRNNLELSKVAKGLNAYRFSFVNIPHGMFTASVYAAHVSYSKTNTFTIKSYDDPRDAAFVGQAFMALHSPDDVRALYDSAQLFDTIKEFLLTIKIPVWEFPAEGLTQDDLTGDLSYDKNRVEGSMDSLREVFKVLKMNIPPLKEIPALVATCEALYVKGMSWRAAALETVK